MFYFTDESKIMVKVSRGSYMVISIKLIELVEEEMEGTSVSKQMDHTSNVGNDNKAESTNIYKVKVGVA
jgi:hypothetical protein